MKDDLHVEVAERLIVKALMLKYGVRFRKGGGRNELESQECPHRSDHGTHAFRFNEKLKRWQCFACNTKGDAFGYVAAMEGLDVKRDFPRVLEIAAQIAGVMPSTTPPEERERRMAELRAVRAQRERAEQAASETEDARAIATASAYWDALPARHPAGEMYLDRRGITGGHIVRLNGRLRFDRADAPSRDNWSSDGSPSLALHDLRDRGIAGVVRRRLPAVIDADPRGVKAPSLTGCKGSGTMAYKLAEIDTGQDAVVTEGIADTITAMVAWPDAAVLGANGTGTLPTVLKAVAERVRAAGGRMLVVPHADEKRQGERAVIPSMITAEAVGLRPGIDLILIDLGNAKDLNEAWCSGWRPT